MLEPARGAGDALIRSARESASRSSGVGDRRDQGWPALRAGRDVPRRGRQPGVHPRRLRAEPAEARCRDHRSVPAAPCRSPDADRGDDRCHERPDGGRQGAVHRSLRGAAVRHPAGGGDCSDRDAPERVLTPRAYGRARRARHLRGARDRLPRLRAAPSAACSETDTRPPTSSIGAIRAAPAAIRGQRSLPSPGTSFWRVWYGRSPTRTM